MVALTGEQIQERGREGVRLAKGYLEGTGRAEVPWDNPSVGAQYLSFVKASGANNPTAQGSGFSFDCGGILRGEGVDGDVFLAEVKKYSKAGNQGTEYTAFLAKCYRVEDVSPTPPAHFLWITWSPFSIGKWSKMTDWQHVKAEISSSQVAREIALGADAIDDDLCRAVAAKLIVIVLADRQLNVLSFTENERKFIRKALIDLRG